MTLAELGDLLRDERVKRGFSVDEVASRLKITSRVVRAIEEGDAESLPHAVYARGFIRAYASLVGISNDEVRPALQSLADPEEEPVNPREMATAPSSYSRRSGRWILPTVVVVCCVAFAVYGVYSNQFSSMTQLLSDTSNRAMPMLQDNANEPSATGAKREPNTTAPVAPATAGTTGQSVQPFPGGGQPLVTSLGTKATEGTSQATPGTVPTPGSLGAGGVPGTVTPGGVAPTSAITVQNPTQGGTPFRDENQPVHTNGFTAPQATAPATTASESTNLTLQSGSTQTDVTNAGKGKHQIIMTSLQECWVHSTADSTDTRQFSLKKGEVFALSFDRKLVIKLGNAGGVRIKYDGKELPAPGALGQVRTLTFPPAESN